jgi:hypothetical protein
MPESCNRLVWFSELVKMQRYHSPESRSELDRDFSDLLCPTVVAILSECMRGFLDLSYVAESCCQEPRAMSGNIPVLIFFWMS